MFDQQLIKKFQDLPTPFYYYDLALLRDTLALLKKSADAHQYEVHYALKANANKRILKIIRDYGFGADCVSGNEVKRALEIGFPASKIMFAGVGKTDAEILFALKNNIRCFNCESSQELEVIDELAGELGVVAPVALRINPDLDAGTHEYITTGRDEDKFGIHLQNLEHAVEVLRNSPNLRLLGLHFHIGSQIRDLGVFRDLAIKVNEIQEWFAERGFEMEILNLGGGLGIDYESPDEHPVADFEHYFSIIHEALKRRPGQSVHFELGRSVVAQCGALISRVLYVKQGVHKQFAVIDAGMTELLRPALYQAYHKIENLTGQGPLKKYDVVGPICESSDFIGKNVLLPEIRRGDLLAIRSTGAYAEVMVSRYNLRAPAPAVYSDDI